ncbi:cell division protein FtsQ/DivIB [Desulfobulbus alkaliphilus]|uniref:cell division protein FtsQ/DivIB n=1 Tax=Desulfobulbus alkaliphilus TaxID=869814 RepID=UPI0019635ACE|nr:FtsQ-type POTRA domain-containing protein [Desulfobulbus alkaliphilus]MBM9536025.1 FtsQ-type POTRA domain-containing protein [Desulfobulbus alkaliphilus]
MFESVLAASPWKRSATCFQTQAVVNGAQRALKWKRLVVATLVMVAVVCLLAAGTWMSRHWLIKSPVFRLTEIRITGVGMITERTILDLAQLRQGVSLFQFDVRAAETRIATHPWIEHVSVKRQWPSTVTITVAEQKPFALVNIEEGQEKRLHYLNRGGRVFARVGQGQELDYPVITGVLRHQDIETDALVHGSLADSAFRLLLLAARGNAVLPVQMVSEVHLDPEQGLIMYLVDQPFPVYLGWDRLQTKYYRLVKILEHLYARKQIDAVKEIRMDYTDDKVLVTGAEVGGRGI